MNDQEQIMTFSMPCDGGERLTLTCPESLSADDLELLDRYVKALHEMNTPKRKLIPMPKTINWLKEYGSWEGLCHAIAKSIGGYRHFGDEKIMKFCHAPQNHAFVPTLPLL